MPNKKKRGAQPQNQNARKHGFYSALFKARERALLDQIPAADLSAEIELIRLANVRFLEALQASKSTLDYDACLTALRAVNLSAHSTAMLLRLQAAPRADITSAAQVPVMDFGALSRAT